MPRFLRFSSAAKRRGVARRSKNNTAKLCRNIFDLRDSSCSFVSFVVRIFNLTTKGRKDGHCWLSRGSSAADSSHLSQPQQRRLPGTPGFFDAKAAPRNDNLAGLFVAVDKLLKRAPFHISAADDDGSFSDRELLLMKQKCRVRNGAAGLGNQMRIAHEPAHRFANLVFAHADKAIDKLLNVLK